MLDTGYSEAVAINIQHPASSIQHPASSIQAGDFHRSGHDEGERCRRRINGAGDAGDGLFQIAAAIVEAPRIAADLEGTPADVVAAVERHDPDAPLFALAMTDSPRLHEYFESLRGVRLEISGADLADLGLGESPRVGEILAAVRRRKLNGELAGRDSELEAARELIG